MVPWGVGIAPPCNMFMGHQFASIAKARTLPSPTVPRTIPPKPLQLIIAPGTRKQRRMLVAGFLLSTTTQCPIMLEVVLALKRGGVFWKMIGPVPSQMGLASNRVGQDNTADLG